MWTAIVTGFGFALGVWLFVSLIRWLRGDHSWIRRNSDYLWAFGVNGALIVGVIMYSLVK